MSWAHAFGKAIEDHVAGYLAARGCTIIARRYRWRHGEIDLVVRDGEELVFVEVRARRRRDYGTGAETVTARKQRRVVASARHFIRERGLWDSPCRFDVVSVETAGGRARVSWLRDAFRP